MKNKNTIIAVVIALILIGGAWYLSTTDVGLFSGSDDNKVIATVSGEKIYKADLEAFKAQVAASQGLNLDTIEAEAESQLNNQVMDALIIQALFKREAEEMGVEISEEEVNSEIAEITTQLGGEEALAEVLKMQKMTEEELREQVRSDLTVQAYLNQELELEGLTATDEEVLAFYNQIPDGETKPALEDVRSEIETLIIQQKEQQLIAPLAEKLRQEAEVEVLI